jgi:parallel beta-helix repeat protein
MVGIFASFNRIGGTESGEENLISGNNNLGVSINGQAQGNIVSGNLVGTTINGDAALGNSQGIFVGTSNVETIVEGNLVGGNSTGIDVVGDNNFIIGNHIGVDVGITGPVPNGDGIFVYGEHNMIQFNIVANNLYEGIRIDQLPYNTIRRNIIYDNTGKGILLTNGGNDLLQPPILTSVSSTSISGIAHPNCTIEIFSDLQNQGRIYEGTVHSDSSGNFIFQSPSNLTGPNITSTVTDKNGSTSEFSDPALITAVENPSIPSTYYLLQNYPNPFNHSTTISFTLLQSDYVTLKIYNLFGQEVATLVNGYRTIGEHEIKWQPVGFSNGFYFCKLQAGEYIETKKLILQK